MTEDVITTDVEVRFRDLDPDGHVNNAVYASYLEQGRVALYDRVIGVPLPEAPTVIVHLAVEYRAPIGAGDDVTVSVSVPELGGSSIPMEYEIRADGDLAATGETVQVVQDPETGESAPIPEEWRRNIEAARGDR